MKAGCYLSVRGGVKRFENSLKRYNGEIELVQFDCYPSLETVSLLKESGCEAMVYTPTNMLEEEFWKVAAENGLKYVVTCSAGYDHFNLDAMKKYGLKGANVPVYSPNAISEHAILLTLSILRNYRKQILNIENEVYPINGLMGKEMRNQVIGIVGAGRIGYTTMKILTGFGPKQILTYDPYPNDAVKEIAEYVSLEELYAKSDVIIYHCIYNEQNHHMVNKDTIMTMKDGVILVNVARGGLFDIDAVYDAVCSGKIGGLAIDVIEGEAVIRAGGKLPIINKLLQHDNVVFTNHTAFFTDEAERNMVDTMINNLHDYMYTGSCKYELVK